MLLHAVQAELDCLGEMTVVEALVAAFFSDSVQFFPGEIANERQRDFSAIFKNATRVVNPLPKLRARDFSRRG